MLQECLKKVLPANTTSCAGFCSTHYLLLSLSLSLSLYIYIHISSEPHLSLPPAAAEESADG
jgi:hypothetical protein